MTDVIYRGVRERGDVAVTVDGRPLPLRLDLVNHSPDGFEFGYSGSGPAQLSLAILADHLEHVPEDHLAAATIAARAGGPLDAASRAATTSASAALAIGCHQAFKFAVIGRLSGESFRLTSGEISAALRQLAGRPPMSAAYELVTHLIRRLHDDGDLAYILGGPSRARALMVKALAENSGKSEDECSEILGTHFAAAAKRTRFDIFEIRGVLEERVTRLEIDDSDDPHTYAFPKIDAALDRLEDFFGELAFSAEELEAKRAAAAADKEEAERKAEIARVQVPLFGDGEGR